MVNIDNRGTVEPRSNSTLYFIVGALVVAVLLGWLFFAGTADVDSGGVAVTSEPAVAPAGGNTDITVLPGSPAPAGDTNVTVGSPAPAAPAGETNLTVDVPAAGTGTSGAVSTGGSATAGAGATAPSQ